MITTKRTANLRGRFLLAGTNSLGLIGQCGPDVGRMWTGCGPNGLNRSGPTRDFIERMFVNLLLR